MPQPSTGLLRHRARQSADRRAIGDLQRMAPARGSRPSASPRTRTARGRARGCRSTRGGAAGRRRRAALQRRPASRPAAARISAASATCSGVAEMRGAGQGEVPVVEAEPLQHARATAGSAWNGFAAERRNTGSAAAPGVSADDAAAGRRPPRWRRRAPTRPGRRARTLTSHPALIGAERTAAPGRAPRRSTLMPCRSYRNWRRSWTAIAPPSSASPIARTPRAHFAVLKTGAPPLDALTGRSSRACGGAASTCCSRPATSRSPCT